LTLALRPWQEGGESLTIECCSPTDLFVRKPDVLSATGEENATGHKEWDTPYCQAPEPKLTAGGCWTTHNVREEFAGVAAFLVSAQRHPGSTTTVERTSRAGIAISCKTAH
jgi:hypothetical protein